MKHSESDFWYLLGLAAGTWISDWLAVSLVAIFFALLNLRRWQRESKAEKEKVAHE